MPRPALLVELAGFNGVGKSTIAPLLAKRLRKRLGPDRVAALPEKDVPRFRRRWTRIQRRLWLATHPARAWSAWSSATPGDWFFTHSTLGLARRALRRGCLVAMVDQGLLRAARDPAQIESFLQTLLPDLVLHLVSDTTTLRQLLRPLCANSCETKKSIAGIKAGRGKSRPALTVPSSKGCHPI